MRVNIVNLNLEGRGAIGQCIVNQARFFQRRGDELQIYLMHPPHDVPDSLMGVTRVVSAADLAKDRYSIPPRRETNATLLTGDLHVFHYPSRYPLLQSIKALERGAVMLYYHNVTPPELWGSAFEQDVLRDSLQSVAEFASYADLIVADSAFNAEQLARDHGLDLDRIRVLPLAVALDRFQPGPTTPELLEQYSLQGKRVILFVGRMAGNKRIDLLVEALSQVRQRVSNAVLMLVGDERSNPAVQEAVARARSRAGELHVDDVVIFTGPVDDLPAYYRMADVYATASLHEGFGVPLIEAMASGLPVVASRATAHPWVLGEAGLLSEPGDASDLANKLVQVLTDDALCGQLVQRGRERVLEFSVERYEEGWSRIVSEVTAWLPSQPYPRLQRLSLKAERKPVAADSDSVGTPSRSDGARIASLEQLGASADVMLRDYRLRSHIPVLGPLIVWIRRNVTSHLREPYLDPTLERQVSFNQRLVRALETLTLQGARSEARHSELEKRLDLLSAETARLKLNPSSPGDRELLNELDQRIHVLGPVGTPSRPDGAAAGEELRRELENSAQAGSEEA